MGARRNHEEGTQMSAFVVGPMDILNGLLDRRVDISLCLVDMTLRHLCDLWPCNPARASLLFHQHSAAIKPPFNTLLKASLLPTIGYQLRDRAHH